MSQISYQSNVPEGPNKLALWAMILGIVGLMLSLVGIGGVLGLVALMLGIVGVIKPGRKGMAIAGLVLGAVSMGVGFLATFVWLGFFMARSRMPLARVHYVTAEVSNLSAALDAFEIDNGRYPTSAEGLDALVHKPAGATSWTSKYIDAVPTDPWGRPYVYVFPGKHDPAHFDLYSVGPDGVDGTADDIGK